MNSIESNWEIKWSQPGKIQLNQQKRLGSDRTENWLAKWRDNWQAAVLQ